MCPLHLTSAEAAARASPMHNPRGVTTSQADLTVCVKYIVQHDLCSRNGLCQPTCLQPDQSPLEREACVRAKRGVGEGWRELVPSHYPAVANPHRGRSISE